MMSELAQRMAATLTVLLAGWVLCLAQDAPPKLPEVVQPRLNAVFPMAAQPGTRTSADLRGEFLDRLSALRFESADLSGKILSSNFTSAQIEIEVQPGAQPGPRFFRVVSPRGVSNLVLFRVSCWPTPVEFEPNDELDAPMTLTTPTLLSARLSSVNDVDLFRFHARAGERLQFNLLGGRNWTAADASLAILQLDGREIVQDEGRFIWDPYMDHVFQQEGDYLAAVTVSRMPAGGQARNDLAYQLSIGQSPFVWSLFPLGARRGDTAQLTLRADFLDPAAVVRIHSKGVRGMLSGPAQNGTFRLSAGVEPDADLGPHEIWIEDQSGTLAPVSFVVGDLPESLQAEPNDKLEQAQPVTIPATVNGRIDRDGEEDWYRFSVEAGRSLAFSIDAEKYGSSLDAQLVVKDASGKTLASGDDAKWPGRPLNRDPSLHHTFKEAGQYFLRVGSLYRTGGEDHGYRLSIRERRPDFLIALDADRVAVVPGGKGKLNVSILRVEDFKEEVRVQAGSLPPGIRAAPLVIAPDKDNGTLEFEAAEGIELPPTEFEVYGSATVEGEEVRKKAELPGPRIVGSGPGFLGYRPRNALVTSAERRLFSLESTATTIYLVKGGRAEFGVRVVRRPELTADLDWSLENMPGGVSVEKVEMIDEGRMARVTLKAEPTAAQTRVPDLVIVGRVSSHAEPAPRVTLQVD